MSYAHLPRIKDDATRDALKALWDALVPVQKQAQNIGKVSAALDSNLDSNQKQLKNVKDPTEGHDAVNYRTLEQYVSVRVAKAVRDLTEEINSAVGSVP